MRCNNQCARRSGAPHLRLMHQHPVERVPTGDDHASCSGVCAEQIGDQGIVIRAGFLAEQRCQQRSGGVTICERNSHKRTGMWTGVIARDPRVTGQPRAQVCVSVHPNVSYHRNCGQGRTPYESQGITAFLRYVDPCLVLPCCARCALLAECRPKLWSLSNYSALARAGGLRPGEPGA